MTSLILRLAAPVQAWGGYRRNVAYAPTHPFPTKSGIAGLLAASTGETDYLGLLPLFTLRIRVDRTNPVLQDLQVAVGPISPAELADADRAVKMTKGEKWGQASWPRSIIRSDSRTGHGLFKRHFIPHAEFVCEITADHGRTQEWLSATRNPVFMPYLGRQSNAPTWPFVLGVHHETNDLMRSLPRVAPAHGAHERIPVHQVAGDYLTHTTTDTEWVLPPTVSTREEQMQWVSTHLTR